ncbi:MAG: hypothetical protein ABI620_02515 [Chloroflexota bacterium]
MRPRALLALTAAVLLAACSSPAATPAAPASAINAQLVDWKITLDNATGKAGSITFSVSNKGANTHEFVVVKTDLAADKLPVAGNIVDESAFTPVDEIEDIEPNATPTLTVTLAAGHYVILCNIEEHYGKGMHADLNVQ